jgi:hypothetical protein
MATTYSDQYFQIYIKTPPAKAPPQRGHTLRVTYTQQLAGAVNDTCFLQQLPPFSCLDLMTSWLRGRGFTSGMLLSLGWGAYLDNDGVRQPANPVGLYDSALVGNTAWILSGGWKVTLASTHALNEMTATPMIEFRNKTAIDLFATFGVLPGAGASMMGVFYLC